MMPLADMSVPPTAADLVRHLGLEHRVSPLVTLLLLFACVVLLETAVLARAAKQPSLVALRDSLTANTVSTLAGVCLIAAGVFVRGETNLPQFAAMFVGSLLLETPVLVLLRTSGTGVARTVLASAEVNLTSYMLIGLLLYTGLMR